MGLNPLAPQPHLCTKCLGLGKSVAWCRTCQTHVDPIGYLEHEDHQTLRSSCRDCGGGGMLADALRRKFLPVDPVSFAKLTREQAKVWGATLWADTIDRTLFKALCSNSPEDPSSTSSPSISKPPGEKTSP